MLGTLGVLIAIIAVWSVANVVGQRLYPTPRDADAGRRLSYWFVVWLIAAAQIIVLVLLAWAFGGFSN